MTFASSRIRVPVVAAVLLGSVACASADDAGSHAFYIAGPGSAIGTVSVSDTGTASAPEVKADADPSGPPTRLPLAERSQGYTGAAPRRTIVVSQRIVTRPIHAAVAQRREIAPKSMHARYHDLKGALPPSSS